MRFADLLLPVLAQQQQPTDLAPLPGGTTGFGVQLFQSALALVAVCVGAWVVLRWMAKRGFGGGANRNLQVIERVMLEPRKSVYLLRAGKRVFLVGASDQSVNTLAELSRDDLAPATAATLDTAPRDAASPARFADVLARIRQTGSNANSAAGDARPPSATTTEDTDSRENSA